MTNGCIVAVALTVIAGLGFVSTAEAACDPRNPTACEKKSRPAADKPIQLKRFMALGPARQTGKRTGTRRAKEPAPVDHASADHPYAPAQGGPFQPVPMGTSVSVAPPSPAVSAEPLAPKPIPTLSISAPALTPAPPSEDRTVGFAAATERWNGETAFASADDREIGLPPGITIAASDEVNEIDLAADAEPRRNDRFAQVSLVTPASAMPVTEPAAPTPEPAAAKPDDRSWFARLYGRLVDGLLTAALALRSLFA